MKAVEAKSKWISAVKKKHYYDPVLLSWLFDIHTSQDSFGHVVIKDLSSVHSSHIA